MIKYKDKIWIIVRDFEKYLNLKTGYTDKEKAQMVKYVRGCVLTDLRDTAIRVKLPFEIKQSPYYKPNAKSKPTKVTSANGYRADIVFNYVDEYEAITRFTAFYSKDAIPETTKRKSLEELKNLAREAETLFCVLNDDLDVLQSEPVEHNPRSL